MFGSVFHVRPKPGQEQDVIDAFSRWDKERRPHVAGAVQALVFKTVNGSGDIIGVAVFESREAYERNAQDPQQERWYQELRSHLAAGPVWEDGEVVHRS